MSHMALLLLALTLPAQTAVKNPVAPSAESVANSGKLYGRYCAACHGSAGKGDGPAGAKFDPKPSNLTDEEWKHGPTDAEILTVIHDGSKGTGMKGYASRMTGRELRDLVNYIRSLGPKT
ncbi:MAG: c-type cytochrome [Acidobacteria bacterium]|nr:c-type cytochrome [Acidobacteriota bacterium]